MMAEWFPRDPVSPGGLARKESGRNTGAGAAEYRATRQVAGLRPLPSNDDETPTMGEGDDATG